MIISQNRYRIRKIKKNIWIYILLIPAFIYYIVFHYLPMYGIIISFKDVSPIGGFREIFFGGEWVGLRYFSQFVRSYYFWNIFRNTIVISLLKLLITFPLPIIFAILVNEVGNKTFKRVVQTISYMPHFLSTVIVVSLVRSFLSYDSGFINNFLESIGRERIYFLGESVYFRKILITMNAWRSMGWGAIIYLAAITGVDTSLYEAARVDGAGKLRQIWHITIPGIASVVIIMLILKVGHILDAGFDEILLLYSELTYDVSDIIDTYVYREGLTNLKYSYTTAVSVFKGIIALVFVLGTNKLAKKMGHHGIW